MAMLVIQAGARAMAHIREHGLRPEDITTVPGAAGGPKGLGLAKLDEWLFADWLPSGFAKRESPIQLIGASIGAWRFACVCRGAINGEFSADKTRASLQQFANAYTAQYYPRKTPAHAISKAAREIINMLFLDSIEDVLTHPHYRLNVLAVRGKGILAQEGNGRTHLGYALAAFANVAGRQHLRHFLDRTWFYANNKTPLNTGVFNQKRLEASVDKQYLINDFIDNKRNFDAFHTEYVALSAQNFADALVASGSIPMILDGVKKIAGAPLGTHWDGGIIDYHLHLPYGLNATADGMHQGLVFYPHFTNQIVPGWLDKMLPWRRARGAWLDNVVMVSPTPEYLARLPMRKLPDRNDFMRFVDDYEGRMKYWRFAMEESARLRDELAESIERGKIAERLQPF